MHVRQTAEALGLESGSWSPDSTTSYNLFKGRPWISSRLYTASGWKEAITWLNGVQEGLTLSKEGN